MSTNTTNLRSAAERLRRARETGNLVGVYADTILAPEGTVAERAEAEALIGRDEALIADAWLKENPADDDEPVTEEFCRSQTWLTPGYCDNEIVCFDIARKLTVRSANVQIHRKRACAALSISSPFGGAAIPLTTRRQVRQLLEVLGVNTKETTK